MCDIVKSIKVNLLCWVEAQLVKGWAKSAAYISSYLPQLLLVFDCKFWSNLLDCLLIVCQYCFDRFIREAVAANASAQILFS